MNISKTAKYLQGFGITSDRALLMSRQMSWLGKASLPVEQENYLHEVTETITDCYFRLMVAYKDKLEHDDFEWWCDRKLPEYMNANADALIRSFSRDYGDLFAQQYKQYRPEPEMPKQPAPKAPAAVPKAPAAPKAPKPKTVKVKVRLAKPGATASRPMGFMERMKAAFSRFRTGSVKVDEVKTAKLPASKQPKPKKPKPKKGIGARAISAVKRFFGRS